ncbi:hypothetical protein ANME2D_00230 [Candidatus Methanoperedens nitroreducens]|uniref:Uncharacterized protein n=1 Tax=Candidatus Methanoperedens nitratireducens TaxID=1392998 RepID=A0A062VD34_9EURY|nr:hypothetical protein [Candidatus Methanoperedens nitroreducens]KCZ73170.1 hypothetical protein ANME2D_00230 [Candidatus Methanoperedens nitroreducens]MDJ1422881.1 hypothetical protein [Candidatus Methanoperedens sp.]
MSEFPLSYIGKLKSKEAPKVIIVGYTLYIWKGIVGNTAITEIPFNTLVLFSGVTLIVTLAGLVFIYVQKKKIK